MKIAHLFGARRMPQVGAGIVADSLKAAGFGVVATLIISADGGSLHVLFVDARNHLLALLGG